MDPVSDALSGPVPSPLPAPTPSPMDVGGAAFAGPIESALPPIDVTTTGPLTGPFAAPGGNPVASGVDVLTRPMVVDPPILDDGALQAIGDWSFTRDYLKGMAELLPERQVATVLPGLRDAMQARSDELGEITARLARLDDPAVDLLERLELSNVAGEARVALTDARLRLEGAEDAFAFSREMTERFGRAATTLFAVDTLIQAEGARDEALAAGDPREAWRRSLGALGEVISSLVPGAGGALARATQGVMLGGLLEQGGRAVADATFDPLNGVAHWLAEQSWWPDRLQPRVPLRAAD